jgi:hypothetical protein
MKKIPILFVLVFAMPLTSMYAATQQRIPLATVVSVESRVIPSNYTGGGASDTPLQPTVYSHDIGIRLGSIVYRATYESAFEDPPLVLSTNHSVQVNLKKHNMYVALPGDLALRMDIDSRAGVNGIAGIAGN